MPMGKIIIEMHAKQHQKCSCSWLSKLINHWFPGLEGVLQHMYDNKYLIRTKTNTLQKEETFFDLVGSGQLYSHIYSICLCATYILSLSMPRRELFVFQIKSSFFPCYSITGSSDLPRLTCEEEDHYVGSEGEQIPVCFVLDAPLPTSSEAVIISNGTAQRMWLKNCSYVEKSRCKCFCVFFMAIGRDDFGIQQRIELNTTTDRFCIPMVLREDSVKERNELVTISLESNRSAFSDPPQSWDVDKACLILIQDTTGKRGK